MKCKCGCNQEVNEGNRFIIGHYWNGKQRSEESKKKMSHKRKLYYKNNPDFNKADNNGMYGNRHSEETKKKMIENQKDQSGENGYWYGKHMSDETKQKMSNSHKGEKCYNWKGGITPENVKIRHSDEYKEWREIVFKRDNFTCKLCNVRGGNLNAHHILSFSDFSELRFELSNGITLCKDCHDKTKGKEYDYVDQFVWMLNGYQKLNKLI